MMQISWLSMASTTRTCPALPPYFIKQSSSKVSSGVMGTHPAPIADHDNPKMLLTYLVMRMIGS